MVCHNEGEAFTLRCCDFMKEYLRGAEKTMRKQCIPTRTSKSLDFDATTVALGAGPGGGAQLRD